MEVFREFGAWYFSPVSNGMGKHGVPDFIACYQGRFIAVECKAPGGRVTAMQQIVAEEIRTAGRGICLFIQGSHPADLAPLRYALSMINSGRLG